MIEGTCHCGKVRWTFDGVPARATACNCTICRRYGGLWAHGWEGEAIDVSGETRFYVWGDRELGFHACVGCGCIAYTRGLEPNPDGRRWMAVNLRMAEPDQVGAIPIRHFDGCETWEERPPDGRTVADMWF
jgi:hypothetical protein